MNLKQASRAVAASAALLAAVGCAHRGGSEPFALVSLDAVEAMLGKPNVVVVDANTRETFEKHHLPGARYWRSAPLAQLLPSDKAAQLVFYCASPS
jgi:rhodanese-related sulfurtransferase